MVFYYCCVGDLGRRSSGANSALVNSFAQQLHNKEMTALSQADSQEDAGQVVMTSVMSTIMFIQWQHDVFSAMGNLHRTDFCHAVCYKSEQCNRNSFTEIRKM